MYKSSQLLTLLGLWMTCCLSCKKETEKTYTPVPFLTGRTWIADTITINPPATYNQLSTTEQQQYRSSVAWFRIATLTLNNDGTVTSGGNYDFGYKNWRLVNNNIDIEMSKTNGEKQLLRNWSADAIRFSYTIALGTTYDGTLIYK